MVHVPRLVHRQLDELAEPELRIARGRLAARRVPAGESREEDAEHRRLDRVEPGVHPDELERPLVARAVEAEHADPLGHVVVETT